MNAHAARLACLAIVTASAAAGSTGDPREEPRPERGLLDLWPIPACETHPSDERGARERFAAGGPGGDPCPGDVTGNGLVNPVDLAALLVDWGTAGDSEFETDCNDDGIVDADDLAIVLADWGPCS